MEIKKKGKDFSEKISAWRRGRKERRAERSIVGMPVLRVGPNRKAVFLLWAVLLSSLVFAVYKNFTAIDRETVYEREVVEERVKDTNRVESFVKKFAEAYYAWGYDTVSKDERMAEIAGYLTEELVMLNSGTISSECPTASEVLAVNIWGTEETGNNCYRVVYSVRQRLTEAADPAGKEDIGTADRPLQDGEDDSGAESASVTEETETVSENFFQTDVFKGDDGAMVIVKNPTIASVPEKAVYQPAGKKSDGTVSVADQNEIEEFFHTFFGLYPTATEKELAYYANTDALGTINRNLVYDGLSGAAYYKEDGKIMAHVCVRYLDQVAKITEISEYTLTMEKGDNWKIVDVK